VGCRRFLERVWRLQDLLSDGDPAGDPLLRSLHRTIRKVSEDFEAMKFNTAVAAMMSFVNEVYAVGSLSRAAYKALLCLLSPVAPHIAEEMWERLGEKDMICRAAWPTFDPALCEEESVEIAVQICGKVRGRVTIAAGAGEDAMREAALSDGKIRQALEGKTIRQVIVVKGRIVNIVAV
jgi:leucyl-tRNA synthetase